MKQLACELCGSTDLLKQNGFFICKNCGNKILTGEVSQFSTENGAPVQINLNLNEKPKLENLLNLARSSFASQNYEQAENFCNQVITIDSYCYEAWKIKGESINYQVSSENPRISEVYNCILTSYKVLNDNDKSAHREEILSSIKTCLENTILFCISEFESQRPSPEIVEYVESTFSDCLSKITPTFQLLGYSADYIESYEILFTVLFLNKAFSACFNSWKTFVFYNYMRDGWNDDYHPDDNIYNLFLNEGDCLLELLNFCTKFFSKKLPIDIKISIYKCIIIFQHELSSATSFNRMVSTQQNVYGAVLNRFEFWRKHLSLSDEDIASRKNVIAHCSRLIKQEYDEDNTDKDANELIGLGIELLKKSDSEGAFFRFDAAVKKNPNSSIGYLGKAVAYASLDKDIESIEQILEAKKFFFSETDKKYINYLINYPCGKYKYTLLLLAVYYFDYEATEYLISLDSNVNYQSPVDFSTGLWLICHKKLQKEDQENGIKIARLLLDKGAKIDVSNINNIALYNSNTNKKIAKIILSKYPEATKGYTPSKSGCYVATCVYGSYDCPEVWTLRRYRDDTLGSTWYGRAFIKTYYAVSPTLVKWFGNTKWFKKMWKGKLDKMVQKLQAQGVENTPYTDKEWRKHR